MSFLPADYIAPVSEGNYYKFKKGENRFRIMGDALTGYEYWNTSKKPVRSVEPWEERPSDMQEGGRVSHFWAFPVYNYEAKKIQIMEVTQKSIQGAIQAYVENKKWGSPQKYDLVVNATGDGLEREYTVIAEPHTPAPDVEVNVDVSALLTSGDPFAAKTEYPENNLQDSPF